jgi:hypothetical protein
LLQLPLLYLARNECKQNVYTSAIYVIRIIFISNGK